MRQVFLFLVLGICSVSCGQNKAIPENLVGVKNVVAQLDSAVSAMYGWEPRDSTYNPEVTSTVSDILKDYAADNPDHEPQYGNDPVHEQKTYDDARVTWAEFKRLCDADKYKEALAFYEDEDADSGKKNAGDFLVFLKHSTQRYLFFSQVLRPLMQEYKGDEVALDEYISLLQLEKAMEDFSIEMQADGNGYIPEVYPYVVRDLGFGLVVTGKIDEALEFAGDMAYAVYGLTGDTLFADFTSTQYAAQLYTLNREFEQAVDVWEGYKDYLNENRSDYDPEALEQCLSRIEAEIVQLQ